MIAAFLCGLIFGWLSYRAWRQAAMRREKNEALGTLLAEHGSYLKHYREGQHYDMWLQQKAESGRTLLNKAVPSGCHDG